MGVLKQARDKWSVSEPKVRSYMCEVGVHFCDWNGYHFMPRSFSFESDLLIICKNGGGKTYLLNQHSSLTVHYTTSKELHVVP